MFITTALLASFAIPAAPITEQSLTWHQGTIETAFGEAGERDTLAAIYFWRNGSEYCTDFYQNTLGDDRVIGSMGEFVLLSAQHGTDAGNALFEKYNVKSLPTVLFINGDGKVEDAVAGFAYADAMVEELARISSGELTVSDFENQIAAADPKSEEYLELRYKHSIKLYDVGNKEGHLAALESIASSDKRGKTVIGCKVQLSLLMIDISESSGGEEAIAEWDIKPIYKLAKKVKNEEGRFEIWDQIGAIEAKREDIAQACEAWKNAYAVIPEDRAMEWGRGVANYIMYQEGERTADEKKFVLALATRSSQLASLVTEKQCECETKPDCDCYTPEYTQAGYLATLARAHKLNGNAELASLTAQQSITLNDSEENQEELSELL